MSNYEYYRAHETELEAAELESEDIENETED